MNAIQRFVTFEGVAEKLCFLRRVAVELDDFPGKVYIGNRL